MQQLDETEF